MTPRGVLGWMAATVLGFFMVLTVVAILATVFAPKAHGQAYSWPDRPHLEALADSSGIDRAATLAIAWEESADNVSPKLRGHKCWWSLTARTDSTVSLEVRAILFQKIVDTVVTVTHRPGVVHHEKDCEVGRFQIKPSTARLRCPGLDVFTYAGNTRCFAQMFAEDSQAGGKLAAIKKHNGTGDLAAAYLKRVLQTIGWLTETESA